MLFHHIVHLLNLRIYLLLNNLWKLSNLEPLFLCVSKYCTWLLDDPFGYRVWIVIFPYTHRDLTICRPQINSNNQERLFPVLLFSYVWAKSIAYVRSFSLATCWSIVWVVPRFLLTPKCACLLGWSLIAWEKTCCKNWDFWLLWFFEALSSLRVHGIWIISPFTLDRALWLSDLLESNVNLLDTLFCFSYLFVKAVQKLIIINLLASSDSSWFLDSGLSIQIRSFLSWASRTLTFNDELLAFLFFFEHLLIH